MKKAIVFVFVLFLVSVSVSAQGIYFDGGIGIGGAWTSVDGRDIGKNVPDDVDEMAVDVGIKIGYGPLSGIPLYVVADLGGIGHRFYDDVNWLQYNSYIVGPGVIYYPIPFLQVAASLGYSTVANQSSSGLRMAEGKGGVAWDISVAADLGSGSSGCLIGLRYFGASNSLETKVDQKSSLISVFVRYAFRSK